MSRKNGSGASAPELGKERQIVHGHKKESFPVVSKEMAKGSCPKQASKGFNDGGEGPTGKKSFTIECERKDRSKEVRGASVEGRSCGRRVRIRKGESMRLGVLEDRSKRGKNLSG